MLLISIDIFKQTGTRRFIHCRLCHRPVYTLAVIHSLKTKRMIKIRFQSKHKKKLKILSTPQIWAFIAFVHQYEGPNTHFVASPTAGGSVVSPFKHL